MFWFLLGVRLFLWRADLDVDAILFAIGEILSPLPEGVMLLFLLVSFPWVLFVGVRCFIYDYCLRIWAKGLEPVRWLIAILLVDWFEGWIYDWEWGVWIEAECWLWDLWCLTPFPLDNSNKYSLRIYFIIDSNYFRRFVSIYNDLMHYYPYFFAK